MSKVVSPHPGRTFDPGTRRWYKAGFAPFELALIIIPATCARCGRDDAFLVSAGIVCPTCSPTALVARYTVDPTLPVN